MIEKKLILSLEITPTSNTKKGDYLEYELSYLPASLSDQMARESIRGLLTMEHVDDLSKVIHNERVNTAVILARAREKDREVERLLQLHKRTEAQELKAESTYGIRLLSSEQADDPDVVNYLRRSDLINQMLEDESIDDSSVHRKQQFYSVNSQAGGSVLYDEL